MEGPLMGGLYWDNWYNDQPIPKDQNFILHESKLLGVPRIRQVKVKNGSCDVHEDFAYEINTCYADYSKADEDKSMFGLCNPTLGNCTLGVTNQTAWSYTDADDIDGSDHQ